MDGVGIAVKAQRDDSRAGKEGISGVSIVLD